jgi:hypothetical protein
MQNFIYKTHHGFGKCTKVLKTKGNLKDVKLAQMKCQKLLINQSSVICLSSKGGSQEVVRPIIIA